MRKRRLLIAGLAATAALAASISAAVVMAHNAPSAPRPDARIVATGGQPINPKAVTAIGGGLVAIPASYYVGTDPQTDPVNEDELFAVIHTAMLNAADLRHWQICGAELRASSVIYRATVVAMLTYPNDMPRDTIFSKAMYDSLLADASLYGRAAVVADESHIACWIPPASSAGRYVVLRGSSGRQIAVTDYDILRATEPVEFLALEHECARVVTAWLADLVRLPVSTAMRGLQTLSEVDKARGIARYHAMIDLARVAHVPCS